MSYRLEYQYCAFRIDPADANIDPPRFVVAIEGGDNNCYSRVRRGSGHREKRSRSWDVCMVGTARQVLKQAVHFAGACEGGSLQPHGKACSPEAYIGRIRRLVEKHSEPPAGSTWFPDVKVPEGHPAVAYAAALSLAMNTEISYGTPRVRIDIPRNRTDLLFDIVDRFPDLMGWQLAGVIGLPAS
jgi:hypothetical protein